MVDTLVYDIGDVKELWARKCDSDLVLIYSRPHSHNSTLYTYWIHWLDHLHRSTSIELLSPLAP